MSAKTGGLSLIEFNRTFRTCIRKEWGDQRTKVFQSFAASAAWLLKNCPPGTEHCREIWNHDIFLFVLYDIFTSHSLPLYPHFVWVIQCGICTLYEHICTHSWLYNVIYPIVSPLWLGDIKTTILVGRISISCRDRNGKPAESSTTTAVALIRAERRIRCGDMS